MSCVLPPQAARSDLDPWARHNAEENFTEQKDRGDFRDPRDRGNFEIPANYGWEDLFKLCTARSSGLTALPRLLGHPLVPTFGER